MDFLRRLILILILGLALPLVTPAKAEAATVSDISKQLICQCGCTLVLANCTHEECMSRDTMTTLIKQRLAQGQSEEQIIQFFAVQYGEQVLAALPTRGFNLTAWILPFAALLLGGVIIYVVINKWVRQGRESPVIARPGAEEPDEEYRHRMEQELAEFTERGFR